VHFVLAFKEMLFISLVSIPLKYIMIK